MRSTCHILVKRPEILLNSALQLGLRMCNLLHVKLAIGWKIDNCNCLVEGCEKWLYEILMIHVAKVASPRSAIAKGKSFPRNGQSQNENIRPNRQMWFCRSQEFRAPLCKRNSLPAVETEIVIKSFGVDYLEPETGILFFCPSTEIPW